MPPLVDVEMYVAEVLRAAGCVCEPQVTLEVGEGTQRAHVAHVVGCPLAEEVC